jgi:hypothetical protein
MKQNVLTLSVVLVLLVSACTAQAAATVNPLDVQHTAEAAAFTKVAQTEEAMPTSTLKPPTETSTPTIPATLTPNVTFTANPLLPTATGLSTVVSVNTSAATEANCNKPLTTWQGPTARFTIVNETRPKGTIVLSLYVVTELGECGYLTDLSGGPAGLYSAGAFVDGKRDFRVFGGFRIRDGSYKITVRNDKILALGSCYPGC